MLSIVLADFFSKVSKFDSGLNTFITSRKKILLQSEPKSHSVVERV